MSAIERPEEVPVVDVSCLFDFEVWMLSWGASERTVHERMKVARARVLAWGQPETWSAEQVRAYLGQRHLSTATRQTYYSRLRSVFEWMQGTGRREDNPMKSVRRPPAATSVPKPITDVELERALARARGHQRAWLLLARYAGLRAHEIAKIRGEDVTETELYVLGKGAKDTFLPTHPRIWEVAQEYPVTGYWFPSWGRGQNAGDRPSVGHVNASAVTYSIGRLFRSLGISGGVHRCRHAYATSLLRAGVNIRVVQTLMRHSSLDMTARYCAVSEDERRAAIRLLA